MNYTVIRLVWLNKGDNIHSYRLLYCESITELISESLRLLYIKSRDR